MTSIKPLAMVALLVAAGIGLYVRVNNMPEPVPPQDFSGNWGTPPEIDIPGMPGDEGHAMQMQPPAFDPPSSTAPAVDIPDSTIRTARAPDASPSIGGEAPRYAPAPAGAGPALTPETSSPLPLTAPGTSPPTGPPPVPPAGDLPPLPRLGGMPTSAGAPAGTITAPAYNPATGATTPGELSPPPAALAATPTDAAPWNPNAPTAVPIDGGATSASAVAAPGAGPQTERISAAATAVPWPPAATAPAPNGPAIPGGADRSLAAMWQRAEAQLAAGDLAGAHLTLSLAWFDPTLAAADRHALLEQLGGLAGTVIYSREHLLEAPYVVLPGDRLEQIAGRLRVPAALLAKINGIAADGRLEPGRQLKVVRGPFDAVVDLRDRHLTLRLAGRYAGRFPIGVGSERADMPGDYVVKNKLLNPTYYGRDRVIDADDAANPLGEHWIGLGQPVETGVRGRFGIHGTHHSAGTGGDDPSGYVRLSARDAADVYDILSVGSLVKIVP